MRMHDAQAATVRMPHMTSHTTQDVLQGSCYLLLDGLEHPTLFNTSCDGHMHPCMLAVDGWITVPG